MTMHNTIEEAIAAARAACASVVASETGYGRRHSARSPQVFTYAPLEAVVEAARAALAGAGLAMLLVEQHLEQAGVAGLVYLLSHTASGESQTIRRAWPLLEGDYHTAGQRLAATLSHAKRHTLLDLLDIVVLELDGVLAATPAPRSPADLRPEEVRQLAAEVAPARPSVAARITVDDLAPALGGAGASTGEVVIQYSDAWTAFVEWRDHEWELRKASNPAAPLPEWADVGLAVWNVRRTFDGDAEFVQLAAWLLGRTWKGSP